MANLPVTVVVDRLQARERVLTDRRMRMARLHGVTFEDLTGWVFPNSHGGLRKAANMRRDWRAFRACHNLGGWFTPYTLRRTVATLLTNKLPTREVSDLLGQLRISQPPVPTSDVRSYLGILRTSSARSRTQKRKFDGSTGRVLRATRL
jgi:fructosamine-3-kinase